MSETVSCQCPHCGRMVALPLETLDLSEDARCPDCGRRIFPEPESQN